MILTTATRKWHYSLRCSFSRTTAARSTKLLVMVLLSTAWSYFYAFIVPLCFVIIAKIVLTIVDFILRKIHSLKPISKGQAGKNL
jgi:hypothetical protein